MNLETRLIRAHIMLFLRRDERERKSVSLARYGAYEVRLLEPPSESDTFMFWLELFDHSRRISVDSWGADDFEEALTTAEYLAYRAEELSKRQL